MTYKRIYDLEERLISFAVAIIDLIEELPNKRAANHLAGQIVSEAASFFLVAHQTKIQRSLGVGKPTISAKPSIQGDSDKSGFGNAKRNLPGAGCVETQSVSYRLR